ncbi:tail fiber/spike domain-containing protein [Proteus terrae]|uniref:tail fiber/spike domain-containing protein n=1 Tax=Proteus terrae TaxID=1574161 RepID=UPI0038510F76
MTVSTELSHEEYVGNGVTTDFDFRFRIFESKHLIVVVADSEGNETTLKNGTDYTIVGAGSYHGGKVVLNKPLAQGWKILLERDLPVVQETDLRNQGKFFAEVHEDAFDYLTMLIQKALGTFSLSLRKPTYLSNYYDAKGNRIANLAPPKLGTDSANKDYVDNSIKYIDSKTLRVKDKAIPALPSAEQRRNKQLGFDNEGYPQLLDPAETGSLGYVLVDSFEKGAEITTRYQALHWESNGGYYRWDGELPKYVPLNSNPENTGGVGAGKWMLITRNIEYFSPYLEVSIHSATNNLYKVGDLISINETIFMVSDNEPIHSFIPRIKMKGNNYLIPYRNTISDFYPIKSESMIQTMGVNNNYIAAQQTWLSKDRSIVYQSFSVDGDNFYIEAFECDPSTLHINKSLFKTGIYKGNHGATITLSEYSGLPVIWAHMVDTADPEYQDKLCGFIIYEDSNSIDYIIEYPDEMKNIYFRTELYGVDEIILWSDRDSWSVKLHDLYNNKMFPKNIGRTGHLELINRPLQSSLFIGCDIVSLGGSNTAMKGNVVIGQSVSNYSTNIFIEDRELEPEGMYPVWNKNTLKYDFITSFRRSRRNIETISFMLISTEGNKNAILMSTKGWLNDGYELYSNNKVNIQNSLSLYQTNRPIPYEAATFGCRDIGDLNKDWFGMDFWGEEWRVVVSKDKSSSLPNGMYIKSQKWSDYKLQIRNNTLSNLPTISIGATRRGDYNDNVVSPIDIPVGFYGVGLLSGAKIAVATNTTPHFLSVVTDERFIKFGYINSLSGLNYSSNIEEILHLKKESLNPAIDGKFDLGQNGYRFKNVYATNGSINTSDERLKNNFLSIDDKEKKAAIEIKASIKKYKLNGGDRIHFGVGAQTVINIMKINGLNPFEYSFICYDKWDDEYEEWIDDNGEKQRKLINKSGDRYGIRYNELLCFIISCI